MNTAFREDLIRKLGDGGFASVQSATVAIAGAGGLGSNCAASLVRSGFRRIRLVDFDRVEPSNLDRQFFFSDQIGLPKVEALKANLLRINGDLEIEALQLRITQENVQVLFAENAIVAECLDDAETKGIMVSSLATSGRLVVAVSGIGGVGESDAIRVRRINAGLVIIGDMRSDVQTAPALSPRVSIAAAKQADVILEAVLKSVAGFR